MITVEKGDPFDTGARALLEASHALMESLFPPEDNHYLSLDALKADHITFLVARDGDDVLGCGAIANMGDYGELKSMFTAEAARGRGVAQQVIEALEAEARVQGLALLRLETGSLLHAAHRLYERNGFLWRGPFADYTAYDSSLFMEKRLA